MYKYLIINKSHKYKFKIHVIHHRIIVVLKMMCPHYNGDSYGDVWNMPLQVIIIITTPGSYQDNATAMA